jgi:hypothetical protein
VYHTHQYQKQNYMLDLGSYVLATKNIYHVMHISHALEGKKKKKKTRGTNSTCISTQTVHFFATAI